VTIPAEQQDAHSKRLLKVCGLLDEDIPDEAVRRARRAYFGALSYVDDNVGKLLQVLKECGLDDNTIVVFSSDHGDMLGERGLWYDVPQASWSLPRFRLVLTRLRCLPPSRYKMSFFEGSTRVPLMISDPRHIAPKYIHQNVSNIDILPTVVDLVNGSLDKRLPMDGNSLVPYLSGNTNGMIKSDTVYGEYCGEGTIAPLMMIRSGNWKLVVCPVDQPQFFNTNNDPHELHNLAMSTDLAVQEIFFSFMREANARWDFTAIHNQVLTSQRTRRVCWDALRQGRFESWDYQPKEEASNKYVHFSDSALPCFHGRLQLHSNVSRYTNAPVL
jgi:arylsulfatase A-like enzyme